MNFNWQSISKVFFITLIMSFATSVFAQSGMEKASEVYNSGKNYNSMQQYEKAIEKFELFLSMADTIVTEDPDFNALVISVKGALPSIYYNHAAGVSKSGSTEETIEWFIKTKEAAEKYNSPDYVKKSQSALSKIYLKAGKKLYDEGKYDTAIVVYDKALEFYPENASVYFYKANTYKKMEQDSLAIDALKSCIMYANGKTQKTAEKSLAKTYMKLGTTALKENDIDAGIANLDSAIVYYPEYADAYYWKAVALNVKQDYTEALVAIDKALELEQNNKNKISKYMLEKGNIYYNNKQQAEACATYKMVETGASKVRAKEIMEKIKCN